MFPSKSISFIYLKLRYSYSQKHLAASVPLTLHWTMALLPSHLHVSIMCLWSRVFLWSDCGALTFDILPISSAKLNCTSCRFRCAGCIQSINQFFNVELQRRTHLPILGERICALCRSHTTQALFCFNVDAHARNQLMCVRCACKSPQALRWRRRIADL